MNDVPVTTKVKEEPLGKITRRGRPRKIRRRGRPKKYILQQRIGPALEKIAERIRKKYKSQDAVREKSLGLCREIIRFSSYTIRALHRRELKEARKHLSKAQENIVQLKGILKDQPELMSGGLAHDAQKEYAEAHLTLSLTTGGKLPAPENLGVSYAAYLNGMGEAVGEMRRYLLDSLRRGELAACEDILSIMDDIYGILVTMDFPDALTGGLRRTTDVVRGVLERTRGDLTLALTQRKLEDKIRSLRQGREKPRKFARIHEKPLETAPE